MSRLAQADGADSCRFVFVIEGNGFEPVTVLSPMARAALDPTLTAPVGDSRWWHRRYTHDAPLVVPTPDLDAARALSALGSQSLVDRSTAVLGLSSKVVGGGHSAFHGALSSTRTIGGSPGGPTIDAWLSGQPWAAQRPFDAVRLGVGTGRPLDFRTVAYGAGRPAPMILLPQTAYSVLFGAVASDAAQEAFQRRGNLLDYALSDVQAAEAAFAGSSTERQKLEQYLASIEDLQLRHRRLIDLDDVLRAQAPESPDTNPLYGSGDALDTLAAQFELATAALLGDLTNVVVLGSGTGGDFGLSYSSVSSVRRHDMQHGSGRDATLLNAVHTVTGRQVDLVAQMARTLADTPDVSGGSMLDHTLIVYVPDNGEQHHSTASEFPMLLIGGQALGLAPGGRTVIYPGIGSASHRQVSNVWNTLGHLVGRDLNRFGSEGPTRVAEGPLSELLA